MVAALDHFLHQTQSHFPSLRPLFHNVYSLETLACYRKFHQLPRCKNHFQSLLMLLANLEASYLRRLRRCYFLPFCYQSLTLANDLSFLRFLHRFLNSMLRFFIENLLLQSNASRNKQSSFCLLFLDPLAYLNASHWNGPFSCTTHSLKLA